MNTLAKSHFAISAKYLGPVFLLDGELTKNAQNLIFARNGTGKSFLSRAFRYLDLHGQEFPLSDAAQNLVSDESADGKGSFSFLRGTTTMGSLQLEKIGCVATAQITDTIFHVFSEDFVHEELRQREYGLDGKIDNQIAVDSTNIKLSDAQEALRKAQEAEQGATRYLSDKFTSESKTELLGKAAVRKQLREYGDLSFERILEKFVERPTSEDSSFVIILKDLDSLKAIPSEPAYPQSVAYLQLDDIDVNRLAVSLKRITSPSSTSVDIKRKIDAHHAFYEEGVTIIKNENSDICPFCEQGITTPDPKVVIDAYLSYFADEEEKHKSELREFLTSLKRKDDALTKIETQIAQQISRYEILKQHLPSKKGTVLSDSEEHVKRVRKSITAVKDQIEKKNNELSIAHSSSYEAIASAIAHLNAVIEKNNTTADELKRAIEKSDEERKSLQRQACGAFELEFANRNWAEIENLKALQTSARQRASDLTALEKSSPSSDARSRVADTFELLLRDFFSEKYIFDKEKFVLRRGDREMTRGPHRTLSDGEKTAIAFCYFVACVHRKVKTNSDYRKLFFVFDDPVTSMSYDFVFSIAQTLKNMSISDKGEISLNPGAIDGAKRARPELLVLTHSSYFFNISLGNRVVKEDSAFALHSEKGIHKMIPLKKYLAPFDQQLKEIYEIAKDTRDPDHSTGNTVRSVLEAIGRFCRPDKSGSLSDFVQHLGSDDGIAIKSVLINSLSHGTYYDETPAPDDLKLACKETLQVVQRYAPGHLEMLKTKS